MTGFGYNVLGFGAGGVIINGLPSLAIQSVDDSNNKLTQDDLVSSGFNTSKFAVHGWGHIDSLANSGSFYKNGMSFDVQTDDSLRFRVNTSGTALVLNTTSTSLISTNTYFQFLLYFDKDNATANDRARLWINGTEITSFSTRENPSAAASGLGGSSALSILESTNSVMRLYQFALFSGSLPAIGEVISGGNKVNIGNVEGLFTLLGAAGGDPAADSVQPGNPYTEGGDITTTSDIPT